MTDLGAAYDRATRVATRIVSALLTILSRLLRYRPTRADRSLGLDEDSDETEAAVVGAPNRPTQMMVFGDVDLVAVAALGDGAHDAEVFELLQADQRSKILDLRPAREVSIDWFERLASSWRISRGKKGRRVAIVLDYERWALWAPTIERALRRLEDRGVDYAVFYTQQAHRLAEWFSDGRIVHNLAAVLTWVRHEWPDAIARGEPPASRPPVVGRWGTESELHSWAIVLRRTAMLIEELATTMEVPALRVELARIAWTFGGRAGETEARHHLSRAMHWLGDPPSQVKCHVLRAIAELDFACDEPGDAFARLDRAFEMAMTLHETSEAVLSLAAYGLAAVEYRYYARAEERLRRALALAPGHLSKDQCADLYHSLARAMLGRGKADGETLDVAQQALYSRTEMLGEAAEQDRALLMLVSARMSEAPPAIAAPSSSRGTS